MMRGVEDEDLMINEEIMKKHHNKLFGRILQAYDQNFGLFRNSCLTKVSRGIIISKKLVVSKGIRMDRKNFDPLQFFDNQTRRNGRNNLESYGFNCRLLQFDFDNSEINFFLNKKSKNKRPRPLRSVSRNNDSYMDTSAMTGDDIDDDDEITATRWVLDSRFELGALKDIVLPEITKKMLKSR